MLRVPIEAVWYIQLQDAGRLTAYTSRMPIVELGVHLGKQRSLYTLCDVAMT